MYDNMTTTIVSHEGKVTVPTKLLSEQPSCFTFERNNVKPGSFLEMHFSKVAFVKNEYVYSSSGFFAFFDVDKGEDITVYVQ